MEEREDSIFDFDEVLRAVKERFEPRRRPVRRSPTATGIRRFHGVGVLGAVSKTMRVLLTDRLEDRARRSRIRRTA